METNRLMDPGFWRGGAPWPAGGGDPFGGWERSRADLEGHVLFLTSGSTGTPKWLALSKDALAVSAMAVNAHLHVNDASCWGLALPVHHVGGFGVAARAYHAACRLSVFGRRWDARAFAAWLDEEDVSHVSLVPTQVVDLVRAGMRAPRGLEALVVGGGRLDDAHGRAARMLGWPVLASYGMTEACSQIATQDMKSLESPYRCAPIPLLPIWRAECDASGMLRICGPALFSGVVTRDGRAWIYQQRPDAWHATRDIVRLDGDMLTPLGRADSQVKILGELVDPLEVERKLAACAENALVTGTFAVVALPDVRAGNILTAVFTPIIPREIGEIAVENYNSTSSGFARLANAVWIESLPLTELGKVRRADLVAMLAGTDTRTS